MAERLVPTNGVVQQSTSARVGYYAQHQMELLREDMTVLACMRSMCDPHTTEEELMSVLGLFLLGQTFFDRQVANLSGGEKCRLVLASLFLKRCNVLLLDEPTNHLDLESREALASALQHFDGTLVMVAHDRWLLSETGCEIWALDDKGIHEYASFPAYDEARHQLQLEAAAAEKKAAAPVQAAAQAGDSIAAVQTKSLSREEQKRLRREQAEARNALHKKLKPLKDKYAKLEEALNRAMEEEQETEQRLADPETYANKELSTSLLARYNEVKQRTESLFLELEETEGQIKAIEAEAKAD